MESTGCNKSGPNPRANHILLFLMDCVLPSAPLAGEEGQFSCNPRMFLTGGEAGSLHFSDQWNYIFETGSWETQPDITDEMSIAKSEAVVDPYNNIYMFSGDQWAQFHWITSTGRLAILGRLTTRMRESGNGLIPIRLRRL